MRRGTNLPRMGDFNQTVVLDVVRRAGGGLARAEVARRTGLSPQTVTNVARRLLDLGLVVEEGEAARRGPGRPGTLLRLDAGSRFAVGVHLDPATMTFVLLDLSGAVVARAVVRERYGDPAVLRVADRTLPPPTGDQVHVRVATAGVAMGDWHLVTGLPSVMRLVTGLRAPREPGIGLDLAGTVAAVGPDVAGLRPG